MSALTLLGLAAGFCTTFAFVPQVIRAWRTRSTKDISLGMLLVAITGVALWLIYGIIKNDVPLIAANVVTSLIVATMLCLKLRHG